MKKRPTIFYLIAMAIYGTIGIVSHYIALPAGLIVLFRGALGVLCMLIFIFLIRRKKPDWGAIKKNLLWLVLAGASLGGNWICLFTSYNVSSVSIGTLFNYLAPAMMILVSPLIFREKLTWQKGICAIVALSGMVLVSGVIGGDNMISVPGILFGLGSALCYVGLVTFNKLLKDIDPFDKTLVMLSVATIVMLPYAMFTTDFSTIEWTPLIFILLGVIGVIHTGLAYVFYFGPMPYMKGQTIAILSYVEPVVSILLSFLVLHEEMSLLAWIGAVLILGATMLSEIEFKKKKTQQGSSES